MAECRKKPSINERTNKDAMRCLHKERRPWPLPAKKKKKTPWYKEGVV